MKRLKYIVLISFLSCLLLSFTSCLVTQRHDNGKHYGWSKKHDKHQNYSDRTIIVYEQDNHKHKAPKSHKDSKSEDSRSKSSKNTKSHKNH